MFRMTLSWRSAVISYLKYTNWLPKNITTYTVLFDYTLCPYWDTNKYLDYVFSPADFCEKALIEVGFKKKQICEKILNSPKLI